MRTKPLEYSTKLLATVLATSALLLASACTASQEAPSSNAAPATPEQIAARGLESAAFWPGLASLCDLNMELRDVNVPRMGDDEAGLPPAPRGAGGERPGGGINEAALGPMKVFDDLYFLGNSGVSAWLVGTEEHGYVLIDALNTDAEAERDIIGGMAALGLDPGKIRHFIVSHGHGDHYGGHRYLTQRLGLPVTMSAPDWALVAILGDHPRFGPAPVRGNTVQEGDIIRLGDTEVRILVTTAHTPGTISPIITVHDNGVPHRAMLWGGTGLNFGPNEARLRQYAASAARLREVAREAGVDIFLSNHPARDGSAQSMRALAARAPGQPNPFVRGADALRAFDLLEYCPLAQAERVRTGRNMAH